MEIKVIVPKKNDVDTIHDVLYRTWQQTYPNRELGILEDMIRELIPEKLNNAQRKRKIQQIDTLDKNTFYKIAKLDTKIVGICIGVQHTKYTHLRSFYVLPEYQRQGVGTALWDSFYKWSNKNKSIVVHVATYNDNAINFYKKRGFIDSGKRFSENRHSFKNGVSIPEMEMMLNPKKA